MTPAPAMDRRDVLKLGGAAALALLAPAAARASSPTPFTIAVADPRYREVARYRFLPANALTLGGLLSIREPGEIVLGANFRTADPEAERKRRRAYRKTIHRERAEEWARSAAEAQ